MKTPAASVIQEQAEATDNPFFSQWATPFGIPPFAHIEDVHYRPAFDRGVEELRGQVAAIADNPDPPSFDNTVKALEQAGPLVDRMLKVFRSVTSTDTNEALKALRAELLPEFTREVDAIFLHEGLYRRVRAVWERRGELGLDEQDARLLELTHRDFARAGAALGGAAKARLKEVNSKLSELTTRFAQNLLTETKAFELTVSEEERLSGLPADLVRAAERAARQKGRPGAWVFGLDRSSFEAFMTHADDRELRRRLFDGYRRRLARGGDTDNRRLVIEIARLRAARAEILGYPSHAHYMLETTMARTPERAARLLREIWEPGLARAREELAEMQAIVDDEGGGFAVEGWDWWYYAEKLRRRKYDFDSSQLKPYFELRKVREGALHVAGKLFGLTFRRVDAVPSWNPRVDSYEVRDRNGDHLGVFMVDSYARDAKKDGAWMDTIREASHVGGERIRPIVTNNLNLIAPADGEPTLLTIDEVETLFHEFGHALHCLMTRARYERFSGTSGCSRDWVELPSQFLEHYATDPQVLAYYASHHDTGELIPRQLVDKVRRARTHNQGFKTTEYIAAALLDLAWHTLSVKEAAAVTDCREFERRVLGEHGLIEQIEPRYRSPYFSHIFSSPRGYSAGYYAYLWSETLDADGFTAFEAKGDVFDPELAARLAEHVYGAGYVAEGDVLYRRFRGADPKIEPLLKARGFAAACTGVASSQHGLKR